MKKSVKVIILPIALILINATFGSLNISFHTTKLLKSDCFLKYSGNVFYWSQEKLLVSCTTHA